MADLTELRSKIDAVDSQILTLLAERMALAHEVAAIKQRTGVAVRLPERIEAVKTRCAELGAARGLDTAYIRTLWTAIVEETCRIEESLLGHS